MQRGLYRSPSRRAGPAHPRTRSPAGGSPHASAANNNLYICHYRNAMYMGGIRSFKREGRGVLLHDNGVSLLGHFLNDALHGHCVFLAPHRLLSADFAKGHLTEAVYRTDGFLLHATLGPEGQLEGKGHLLNFTSRRMFRVEFRGGAMVEKVEEKDAPLLGRVFDLGETECIVGQKHARVLRYDIERSHGIEVQKYGNKLTVGFEKGGLVNGLGVTVLFRGSHGGYNPDTHRTEDDFELRVLERGYMSNSQLQGMGEKWFNNGNSYVGEFKAGLFEGNGVLRNASKGQWVSGYFERGNLVDLAEHQAQLDGPRYTAILEGLHERRNSWINNEVALPALEPFDAHIELILASQPTLPARSLHQRKQAVLRRIQDDFLADADCLGGFLEQAKREAALAPPAEGENVKRFVYSFTPEALAHLRPSLLQPAEDPHPPEGPVEALSPAALTATPTKTHLRRSKIFERTGSTDRYRESRLSRRSSRTPDTSSKRKIFNSGTASNHRAQYRSEARGREGGDNPELLLNSQAQEESSHPLTPGDSVLAPLTPSNRSPPEVPGSSSAAKSKIFREGQRRDEESSPKFVYTQVERAKEAEKRRRLGLDDSS